MDGQAMQPVFVYQVVISKRAYRVPSTDTVVDIEHMKGLIVKAKLMGAQRLQYEAMVVNDRVSQFDAIFSKLANGVRLYAAFEFPTNNELSDSTTIDKFKAMCHKHDVSVHVKSLDLTAIKPYQTAKAGPKKGNEPVCESLLSDLGAGERL